MRCASYAAAAAAVASLFLIVAPAAARPGRVARPALPAPMPQLVIGECPGLPDAGCYIGIGEGDVNGDLWPRGAVFTSGDRFQTAHELGHAFDETMVDTGERNRFATLLGKKTAAWSASYTDPSSRLIQTPGSLSELFADAYANCFLGHVVAPDHVWEAGYGYYPTARAHRLICGMIKRAGADKGAPVDADGWR
jgi:hypothetical protein